MTAEFRIMSDVLLLAGLVALGVGFLWRDRRKHLARVLGWATFAVFWIVQLPAYAAIGDLLNALGSIGAFVIFLYLAHHERLSYRWDDEYEPLRFVAGAAFIAASIYFAVDRVPQLSAWLIEVVAQHTAGFLGLFQLPYTVGPADLVGNPPLYRVNGEEIFASMFNTSGNEVVRIVLACTALQGLAIAAALIFSVREPPRRKGVALAVVLPATYITNLARNVLIIYFFDVQNIQFELVHGYYGKALALAVLVVLVVFCFWLLPELYVNINGLFELPWRKGPAHDYKKYIGRFYKRKDEEKEPRMQTSSEERTSSSHPSCTYDERRKRP